MKSILSLTFVLGCNTPETAVESAGGKEPILCLRQDKDSHMFFCRDAEKKIWVCNDNKTHKCVDIERVRSTMNGVLPEKPQ